MGKWAVAMVLGATLWTPPLVSSGRCAKKPVDACGCHHVYGVRHCHPNRKTSKCEAVAEAETGNSGTHS